MSGAPAASVALAVKRQVGINVEPSYRPWRWAGGPNPDSWWDPASGQARIDAEMPLIAAAHAATVRVEFPWTFIEPGRGVFDFSHADSIVSAAVAYGVGVQAILVFCPSWEGPPNCVPSASDYAAFVSAVATRYRGEVHIFEMGNEPDLSRYFSGSETQWIQTMLDPGYEAVKAVDPTDVVVSSGMAYPSNLGWIDTERADDAEFDVQAYHDYPSAPNQIVADGVALSRRMKDDGFSQPLWLDEFGVQQGGVADTLQQRWLTRVLTRSRTNPISHVDWYNLRDDDVYCSATVVCSSDTYGLLEQNLTPKAAFRTFRARARAANR